MNETRVCPECGLELPADSSVCPRCLLEIGLELDREHAIDSEAPTLSEDSADLLDADLSSLPGDTIGPYRLLEVLGEGGMGVVFLAEQRQPIRRKVALKIIKLGMDSREVIARFEAERQALAMMSHPNIAKVFDAGTTQDGRPYFVMEHVAGIPITDYCDTYEFSADQRLEIFTKVCDAAHHAHQRGLIHRDLKPSNILVTVVDGEAHPKIIDFGLAKATQQHLTERTLFTQRGLLIGTPAYMSPEQAEMGALDIDTTSDIYSLGVLLYELLTGALPFDPRQLRQAGFAEMLRIIREEEPAKPSTKVSSLGPEASDIAKSRHTDPPALRRSLQGDLDWIVLKTLDKDRTRRYQAATELADDVRRHLRHEPVSASPPGRWYRARKFVRRHRGLVTSLTAIFLLITVAAVVASVLYARAERERSARNEQLVDMLVERGMEIADNGDNLHALPWLVRALELEEKDELPHRLRIQSVFDHSPKLHRLWNHDGPVTYAEFSPDGKQVASGSDDHTARVWNIDERDSQGLVLQHQGKVNWVSFSSDGRLVATASEDGTARVWSAENGRPVTGSLQHDGSVNFVGFHPARAQLITCSDDGAVRSWDPGSGALDWRFQYGPRLTQGVFQRQREGLALLGGSTVQVLDSRTGEKLLEVQPSDYYTLNAAFSADDTKLVTSSSDGEVRMWDIQDRPTLSHTRRASFLRSQGTSVPMAINEDGVIAAAGWDGDLKLWSVESGEELPQRSQIKLATGALDVQLPPAADWIVTAGVDGAINFWTREGRKVLPALRLPGLTALALDRDSSLLLTAGSDGGVRLWDLAASFPPTAILDHSQHVWSVSFNSAGTLLATGSGWYVGRMLGGVTRLWDPRNGRPQSDWLPEGSAAEGWFTPDGTRLVMVTSEGEVAVRDGLTGALVGERISLPGPWPRVAISPDSRLAAVDWGHESEETALLDPSRTGSLLLSLPDSKVAPRAVGEEGERVAGFFADGTLVTTNRGKARIWEIPVGSIPMREWEVAESGRLGSPGVAHAATRQLATIDREGRVSIWEGASGEKLASFSHESEVTSMEFDPPGALLATGTLNGRVLVRDIARGEVLVNQRHERLVYATAFSPDSRWLLTASDDGTARIWDTLSGQPVTLGLRHIVLPTLLHDAEFAPDGRTFATAGDTAQIWSLEPSALSLTDLLNLTELHSGERVTADGVEVPDAAELAALWTSASSEMLSTLTPLPRQVAAWSMAAHRYSLPVSQEVNAATLRGREIRYQAWVRTEAGKEGRVQLWLAVYKADGSATFFDNMIERPITGDSWQRYAIVGSVAEDASRVRFGVMYWGPGSAWVDDVSIDTLGLDDISTPATGAENLSFESASADGTVLGWAYSKNTRYRIGLSSDSPVEGEYCLELSHRALPQRLELLMDAQPSGAH